MASTASTGAGIGRPGGATPRSPAPLALRGLPSAAPSALASVWRAAGRRSGLSAAVLSGSPEEVLTGDDASLLVSFGEQCLGSAPIMALAGNPAWRGPLGGSRRAAGTGRDGTGARPVTAAGGHCTGQVCTECVELKNRRLEVPGIPPNSSCEAWYLSVR